MDRKVGQITLYNYNYGSALQCFATQQVAYELKYTCILFRKAVRNKIINKFLYSVKAAIKMAMYPSNAKEFVRMMRAKRKTALSAMKEQDFKGIQQFIDEDINSVEMTYGQMRRAAYSSEYDAFLSGSDQVWNGSWFLKDKMFFLKFVPKEKRIAWAPSFGMDHIAPYNCRRFARDINEYKYLSVREKSGVDIIKNLTGRDAVQLSDPVLMLTPEQWRRLYKNRITAEIFYKEYVFFYFLNEPSTYVLDYLDLCLEKGKTIVAFASNYECLKKRNNIVFRGGSPWNYLALLDGASEICSDSYHALAFSLLFHKQMHIFCRNYLHSSDQSERITSIMNRLNIRNRFIEKDISENDIEGKIDFDFIDDVLSQERTKAKLFLTETLEGYTGL